MENTGIRTEVVDEIRILARKYDVNKVILFGSRARGFVKRAKGEFYPLFCELKKEIDENWL